MVKISPTLLDEFIDNINMAVRMKHTREVLNLIDVQ